MNKKHLMLMAAAALPLAACNSGNGAIDNGPTTPPPASIPLVALVNQMFSATNDTSSPIEINRLPIETTDDNPSVYTPLII